MTSRISYTKPVALGLILCDNIYRDPKGKRALVGLFSRLNVKSFPATPVRICVFVALTEVYPNVSFEIDVVFGENDASVFHGDVSLAERGDFPPSGIIELDCEIEGLSFPEQGTYFIRFFANSEVLIQRPFEVAKMEKERPANND